jgi:hypothetical protein
MIGALSSTVHVWVTAKLTVCSVRERNVIGSSMKMEHVSPSLRMRSPSTRSSQSLGADEGPADGTTLEILLGPADARAVGATVGPAEGTLVGATVGPVEGALVEGALLGPAVGPAVVSAVVTDGSPLLQQAKATV